MYESEVMILTGAGASIPCGVPGTAGMADRFEEEMQGTEYEDTYTLLRDLGASADVEDILELSNSILTFADDSVQNLVEKCVAPRGGSNPLDRFHSHWSDYESEIDDFRDKMFDWITDTCLEIDQSTARNIYTGIVRAAADRNVPVFTTNYDAVLDYVAREQDIPIVDNFVEDARGREFWDENLASFHGDGLRLVKIHGSIQWHADPDGTIEKFDHKVEKKEGGIPLERLLIFPTRFKDIYKRNYFPLYSTFTRSLGQAEVLIVIGHSLRDEYLRAAIRERLRRGDLSLVFVGPDFPAEEDLKESVTGQRERQIVYINRKVEEVHALLYQSLRDVPSRDIRSHLRQAREDLSRGRKDKISINDLPQYVEEGSEVEFEVEWDTVVGGGELTATYDPDKKKAYRWPLSLEPLDGGKEQLVVNGRQECSRRFKLTVPEEEVDKYRVRFVLEDVQGDEEDVVERVFTITS